MLRALIIATVAALVAGIAIFVGLTLFQKKPHGPTATVSNKICFSRDMPFVEGAGKNCYSPAELAGLAKKPVLDEDGDQASVNLSNPSDVSGGMQIARNCEQFRTMKEKGWYALSSKDMRREALFDRACGAIATLARGQPAKSSAFAKSGLTEADVKSLAAGPAFRFGPEAAMPASPTVTRSGEGWRLESGGQTATIEQIAEADFNADGHADILVFVTLNAKGGTATASEIGILEKPSKTAPVRFAAK